MMILFYHNDCIQVPRIVKIRTFIAVNHILYSFLMIISHFAMNKIISELKKSHEALLARKNAVSCSNGVWDRYRYPVLTAEHTPLFWRYDLNPESDSHPEEIFGINGTFNSGAIRFDGRYILAVRVEGADRKSFFAIAESPNGIDNFRFWPYPVQMGYFPGETNVYDMRLTLHEDGWIYGLFCSESKNPAAPDGDMSSAVAACGIVRTHDLKTWERLPNLESRTQQRNVVLHPEFVDGRYALYTRPQDDFINAGLGGGIGWALTDDMAAARISDERIINTRAYHTVKELKNGEGPSPIRTREGWLHLAHGVRGCAAGLRYVLYLYLTSLERPWEVIAEPAGYFLAPIGEERVGDVSNVLFSNGWIADDDGTVYIYYASSDTRMHVATSTIERLLYYCHNAGSDGLTWKSSVDRLDGIIDRNMAYSRK